MDVVTSLLYFFTAQKTIKPLLSNNAALYGARFDKLGLYYYPICGNTKPQTEISRLMNRQLTGMLFQSSEIEELYHDVNAYGKTIVTSWAEKERNNITQFMRDLLSTLRSLLQGQNQKDNSLAFVTSLGRLLNYSTSTELTQVPCLLFKAKLELIKGTTVEENTKEVEVLLHELKSNVLKILFMIKQLEGKTSGDVAPTITSSVPRTKPEITL
jgi:hypothetical protein